MLLNLGREHPITHLKPAVDGHKIPDLAPQIWNVHVDDTVREYMVQLIFATRRHPDLALGASPRGTHALYRASQAYALAIHGREYVLPDDVKFLAPAVLAHRCLIHPETALRGQTTTQIIHQILQETELKLEDAQ